MKRAWAFLSIVPILVGLIPILGWLTGINFLTYLNNNYFPYPFNPAFCFILAGSALIFTIYDTEVTDRIQMVLGAIIMVIAALTVAQDLFGINLYIDDIIKFQIKNNYTRIHPGRMAPNTALALILCGMTYVLLPLKNKKWAGTCIEISIFILFLISIMGIAGYVLNMEFLYSWYGYKRFISWA
jgi:hypothetical protein